MDLISSNGIEPIRWINGVLFLLDQRSLPAKEEYLPFYDPDAVAAAISNMIVRGAPAIGITAAYGMVLAAKRGSYLEIKSNLKRAAERLISSRPTAVNLKWGVERILSLLNKLDGKSSEEILSVLEKEAMAIHAEDIDMNRRIGSFGATLLPQNANVLTHCNAGALATGGYGTALGVIRSAFSVGRLRHVYVDETRPRLQGARLTAWELMKENIPMTLISDNMAAHLMATDRIDAVIVGADRIAANGDTANKIGTYGLAILARYHKIPFYVAAPTSTLDLTMASGMEIPIEERSHHELTNCPAGCAGLVAPEGVVVKNPSFDVTPAHIISAIITERGVHFHPISF